MKTRPIEMGVAFSDGQWESHIVQIPADTSNAKLEEVGGEAVIIFCYDPRTTSRDIIGTWVYNSMEDECPDVDRRADVRVRLSFDLNQITSGTELEQKAKAVERVNLALQDEPFGLGARIDLD